MSPVERYWLVGFEDSVPRAFHSEHDARMYAGVHDGQELGEYVPVRQLRGPAAENEKLRLQVAALENDGMELAARLGEAEEQIARSPTSEGE